MYAPIIVPITNTREVNCIVEAGVRYCENKQIAPKDLGMLILGIVVLFVWFGFWIEYSWRKSGYITFAGILAPFVLIALFLIFI